MFSLLTSHFQGLSHLSSGLRLLSFLSLLLSFILQLACYNSVQKHTSDHSHVVGILMSCKARICCGWSVLFVSFLPFSSSRGSRRNDDCREFSAGDWAVGTCSSLASSHLNLWLLKFSTSYMDSTTVPWDISILSPLVHFLCLLISSCREDWARVSVIRDSVLFQESPAFSKCWLTQQLSVLTCREHGCGIAHVALGGQQSAVAKLWSEQSPLACVSFWHFSSLEKKRGASLSHLWITSDSTVTPRGRRTELPCSPNSYRMMGREACCRLSLCSLCTVMAVNVEKLS